MTSDPDWWARGVAGFGTLLGAASLYLNQSSGHWKRMHAAVSPLEDSVRTLGIPVEGWRDNQVVQSLFSASAGAALAELERSLEKIPDWQFRAWLKRFVDSLQAVRGAAQSRPAQSGMQIIASGQKQRLKEAETLLPKLLGRIDKSARKGSS